MKKVWLSFLFCAIPRLVIAQPIHNGCPDYNGVPTTTKVAYNSSAEWITESGQLHKGGPNTNSMNMLGHTHEDMGFPYCGEFGAQLITVPMSQTLFMTDGHIDGIKGVYGGDHISGNVVSYTVSTDPFAFRQKWLGIVTATDKHPSWPMPTNTTGYPLKGSDTGVSIIELEVTLDLSDRYNGASNGWTDIQVETDTSYDNGDSSSLVLRLPFWSTADPTGPMYSSIVRTAVITHTVFTSNGDFNFGSFGLMEASPLPTSDPISSDHPFTVIVTGYAYTSTQSNFSRNLVDANLHAGDLGIIYGETSHGVTPASFSRLDVTFPGGLSPGIHSDLAQWEIQGPAGFEDIQEWANLKYYFVVGTNINPPPPVQTWQIINTFNQLSIQQLFDSVLGFLDQYRLCTTICSNSIQ